MNNQTNISAEELEQLSSAHIVSENSTEHLLYEVGEALKQQAKQAQIQNQQAIEQVQYQVDTSKNQVFLDSYILSKIIILGIIILGSIAVSQFMKYIKPEKPKQKQKVSDLKIITPEARLRHQEERERKAREKRNKMM